MSIDMESDFRPTQGATAEEQEVREMVYVVQAGLKERGSGTFKVEAKTRRGAIEKARDLRKEGLEVTITGPDGKPVDETEDE